LRIPTPDWLAGSAALGVALLVVVVLMGRPNRSFLRDVANDPERLWRGIARVAACLSLTCWGWITVFDDWRRLIDAPYRLAQRYPSERAEFAPTPETLRAVSLVLLVASLVPVAALVARHVGGYGVQLALLIGAAVFWPPLYLLRRRLDFDLDLATTFGGELTSPGAAIAYAVFLLGTWLLAIATILLSYLALLMVVAPPVTLLLDLLHRRRPRPTAEATPFFTALGDRAARGR